MAATSCVPVGRGRSAARPVYRDFAPHRPPAAEAAASASMRIESNMDDDHPTGEVRPVIVRDVLDAAETHGESVGMRFCAASDRARATGALPVTSERRILSVGTRQRGNSH